MTPGIGGVMEELLSVATTDVAGRRLFPGKPSAQPMRDPAA